MTPGSVIVHDSFVFADGDQAKKILVILGSENGITVAAKTTSNGTRFGTAYGCQVDGRFPCFHLPLGSCFLNRASWVCLDEFYEFRHTEILMRHFSGRVRSLGRLGTGPTADLLGCAVCSDDISSRHETIVRAALDGLRSGADCI